MTDPAPWPTEIKLQNGGGELVVSFDNEESYAFSAEFLRVESPSAEVKGHGKGQEVTVPGKRNVKILEVEPVGNYAVRLLFDDRHDTGIYSWTYFLEHGRDHDAIWTTYLEKLEAEGKSRG